MIKVLIISIILVAIAGILLATSILFKRLLFNKQGHFPDSSIGHNPHLKKMGISCAKGDARKEFNQQRQKLGCDTTSTSSCGCG